MTDTLNVAIAQIAPVWLDRDRTLARIISAVGEAADGGADLVAFGEALLPGYPFWLALTGGAEWDRPVQKELHAHYMANAVTIEDGHLDDLCTLAADRRIAIYLGCIERPGDRGGHSLYATLAFIDRQGRVASTHRKLMPTHDERLTWAPGDGHGLRVHRLDAFTAGGLNCWENWMPLPRAALYGLGEDLHVAAWPGSLRNTEDITRFIAKESRSYVVSVGGLMRRGDFPVHTPHLEAILDDCPEMLADGGSCIAAPDGSWVIEPRVGSECVEVATIDHRRVREERQNFDPAGHYARPDVTRLSVDRRRQATVDVED